MENSRENIVNEDRYTRSSARENFRHLNASNRSRVKGYLGKNSNYDYDSTKSRYDDRQVGYVDNRVSKDFRRFLISAVLVSFVVIVKILDFGYANAIEEKLTSIMRSSSTIDSKISNSLVSLGEKMGINIEELTSLNSETDGVTESEKVVENEVVDSVEENNVVEESSDTVEEQISDFYIDDEVLEGVFEDEKK